MSRVTPSGLHGQHADRSEPPLSFEFVVDESASPGDCLRALAALLLGLVEREGTDWLSGNRPSPY